MLIRLTVYHPFWINKLDHSLGCNMQTEWHTHLPSHINFLHTPPTCCTTAVQQYRCNCVDPSVGSGFGGGDGTLPSHTYLLHYSHAMLELLQGQIWLVERSLVCQSWHTHLSSHSCFLHLPHTLLYEFNSEAPSKLKSRLLPPVLSPVLTSPLQKLKQQSSKV